MGYTEREMIGNNRGVTQASTVNTRKMLHEGKTLDWLQSLKQIFINVSYHIYLTAKETHIIQYQFNTRNRNQNLS